MATPPRQERRRLIDLLVGAGLLDRADVPRAMALVKQTGGHLLRVIVDEGWVDEDRLIRALSSALGVEAVTPATMKIHERVLSLVPARLALRYRALPIAIKRANQTDYLYVAIGDPLDVEAIDELQRASGCRINALIAPPTQLDAAIARYYGAAQEPANGLPSASSLDRRRPQATSATPSALPAPMPTAAPARTPAPWVARSGISQVTADVRPVDPRTSDVRTSDARGPTAVSGPPPAVGMPPPQTSGLPAPVGVPSTPPGGVRPGQQTPVPPPTRNSRTGATLPPASPAAPASTSAIRAPLVPAPAPRSSLSAPAIPSFPAMDEAWARPASFRPPDAQEAKTQLDTNILELMGEVRPQDTVRGLPTFVRPEPPRLSEPPPPARPSVPRSPPPEALPPSPSSGAR